MRRLTISAGAYQVGELNKLQQRYTNITSAGRGRKGITMAATIVERVVRMHFNASTGQQHVKITGIKEADGLNRVFEAIGDFADLAAAIAFILATLAPLAAGDAVNSGQAVGDLHALAGNLTAQYPTGYIGAAS